MTEIVNSTMEEYLARPLIEDVVYEITNSKVAIRCSHTLFVSVAWPVQVYKGALLNLYGRVLKKAKESGCRISYTCHFKRTIVDSWDEYEKVVAKAQNDYVGLYNLALKIRERGIHLGTIDDEDLNELSRLANDIQCIHYRSSIYSKISSIQRSLEKYLSDFDDSDKKYVSISL